MPSRSWCNSLLFANWFCAPFKAAHSEEANQIIGTLLNKPQKVGGNTVKTVHINHKYAKR